MPPKQDKRKSVQEEKPASLSDPINTDEWRCTAMLIVEKTECDVELTKRFTEEASAGARKEVKSVDFECDVMRILKQFIVGEISYRYSFLLNFSEIFQEAAEHVKNSENIPGVLMVKVIKALILLVRKEDSENREKLRQCDNNPIEVMAATPLVPIASSDVKGGRKESNANGKKKGPNKKTSDVGMRTNIRVRPETIAKEDTKLLRRGQQVKDRTPIDDVPKNSYFHAYIALTGFRDPDLALEMIKAEIPLHSVLCVDSTLHDPPEIDNFWNEFVRLLWLPELTQYFRDVVFRVFTPKDLPQGEKDLRTYIYREISFLMYDISDLVLLHRNYHRHMRLWSVDEQENDIDWRSSSELEDLPHECVTIPLIMQSILDAICGEDNPDRYSEEPYEEKSLQTPSSYSTTTPDDAADSKASFTSLIPFSSTVKLPTPRWSQVLQSEEKQILYRKMSELDRLYGLDEENADGSCLDLQSLNLVCTVKKQRLPCANLDLEILTHSQGLLGKFWRNYPRNEAPPHKRHDLNIAFPEFKTNYLLYIIWISRKESLFADVLDEPPADAGRDLETKYTVTDGSRMALHKIFRANHFFSPSQLKIVSGQVLESLSEPQLRVAPSFPWAEKSFVSDSHLPVKYLRGSAMQVFRDLREYIGERAFCRMKDYNFIEELGKTEMIRRVEALGVDYDCITHSYSPLTDSIYVVMYNNPVANGVQREVYNTMLTTPVGLRDFHDYVLDNERDWLQRQGIENHATTRCEGCPNSLYNPTPDFRGFVDTDFWAEDSIKYMTRGSEVWEDLPRNEAPGKGEKVAEEAPTPAPAYAQSGEPYRFVGFDFEPGAVQYSGLDTTFRGCDNSSVRVSLQERLYGKQQLTVHVQQRGHHLRLFSYVCPRPHIDQPHTFHVEYSSGVIVAFSRCMKDSTAPDESFAYNMTLSFPHGLTIRTVRNHPQPCHIKQFYLKSKDNPDVVNVEKSRLFLPNGSIIRVMKDGTVQVLKMDTSVTTASLEDLITDTETSDGSGFRSYCETLPNGHQYSVVDGAVLERNRLQIIRYTDLSTQVRYFGRMDSTKHVLLGDGTLCVEFPDGSKICSSLYTEDTYLESEELYGEDAGEDVYVMVHMKVVMEHPDYAGVAFDSKWNSWKILLQNRSDVEVDSNGCYHVHVDARTEVEVTAKTVRMWTYSPRDELTTSTVVDLTAFRYEPPQPYCTTIDASKKFVVESDGHCYAKDDDGEGSSTCGTADPDAEPKRYFVVRRDLSGFEIIHTKNVKKQIEALEPEVVTHCEVLKTEPATRYLAFVRGSAKTGNRTFESTTMNVTFRSGPAKTSSTYGAPPSWTHPFPRRKPPVEIPEALEGRIILEINPTDCPSPGFNARDYAFCGIEHFPEPKMSLSENVQSILRKVADQDQDTLREIYCAAMRLRADSNKLKRSGSPQLERYLEMSRCHVKKRQSLKEAIRTKAVLGYFDYPSGMAWSVMDGIMNEATKEKAMVPEAPAVESATKSSKDTSEVEYNLDWSSEPSYSDLSYRSNLSMKTAPSAVGKSPLLPPTSPREAKSEPIYKMEDIKRPDDDVSYRYGDRFSPPSSEVCLFTKEDLLTLGEKTLPQEPEQTAYELEDLMNLGLV